MSLWPRLALLALPALVACSFGGSSDDDDDDDGGSSEDGGGWDEGDGGWDDMDDGGSAGDGGSSSGDGGSGGGDGGSSGDGGSDGLEWPDGDPTGCNLSGEGFVLDLGSARILEPAGLGPLLLGKLESDIALKVTSQTSSSAQVFVGLAQGGEQDPCTPTSDLPTADWDDPVLSVGPTDLSLDLSGYEVPLSNFTFAAAANGSCDALVDGVLVAELDMRLLAPLLGDLVGTTDPASICELMAGFGATCEACSSDGSEYCLAVAADRIDAPGGVYLEEISSADVAGNPECN